MMRRWAISPALEIPLDRPCLMAIVNVTPDSFSDGGRYETPPAALRAARQAVAEGADVLDIGGESTRPGATRVAAHEQIARVVPVIRAIRESLGSGVAISVDTTLASVADAAIAAGASIINDVSAGLEDPAILTLAAERRTGLVLMHRLTQPQFDRYSDQYQHPPLYGNVVEDVRDFLSERVAAARAAGVRSEAMVIDPGLGFGKTVEQNLELIRGTPRLAELGFAVLSGLSRKSFVGRVSGLGEGSTPGGRLAGSVALSVVHAVHGASVFRVHDVGPVATALKTLSETAQVLEHQRDGPAGSTVRTSPAGEK
jgi:dihydropteroate synthase